MRLLINNGVLFADGIYLCYAGSGNARNNLDDGCYSVEIRSDARGGDPYIHVDGIGRVGAADGQCDIVLGSVLGRDAVVPCPALVQRLLALVEREEDAGRAVVMEINNG